MTSAKRIDCWLLTAILACALGIRLWHLTAGIPYGVEVDEPVVIDRALHILSTGSWYPLGFDYPSLVVYFHACLAALRYLWGATQGQWKSLATFDIGAVYTTARFATALIGTATVWLTYRLGRDLESPSLGLVAAAQLAVYPMHVRESHFALTDVPATALVLLTLWLTVRASRSRTVAAYAWAGCAAGLSAAAKYNGGVVAVMIAFIWLVQEYRTPDRWQKAWAALAAMVGAFLVTVPYAVLALPVFLNGLGGQLARFSSPTEGASAPWRTYLTFLSLAWRFWVPVALLGVAIVLWRRRSLKQWLVLIGFVFVYFYVLSTHTVVFGRYALPILPAVCLLAAVPVVELARFASERYRWTMLSPVVLVLGTTLMTAWFAADSVAWLNDFARPDTRVLAARWMLAAFPKATPMVVENSGPTNLAHAGFDIVDEPNVIDDGALNRSMKPGLNYIVISRWSAAALPRDSAVVNAGRVVFSIDPSADRWGPFVRVVQVER